MLTKKSVTQHVLNPDLNIIDWNRVIELFQKVNWRHRLAEEVAEAFRKSSHTLFLYDHGTIIGFGRVIGDGRYNAMLADVIVDPDYRRQGLGRKIISMLKDQLIDYHFVNLTAAPGSHAFYKALGWKKQSTSYIWPQGPKQLRQHCEPE